MCVVALDPGTSLLPLHMPGLREAELDSGPVDLQPVLFAPRHQAKFRIRADLVPGTLHALPGRTGPVACRGHSDAVADPQPAGEHHHTSPSKDVASKARLQPHTDPSPPHKP